MSTTRSTASDTPKWKSLFRERCEDLLQDTERRREAYAKHAEGAIAALRYLLAKEQELLDLYRDFAVSTTYEPTCSYTVEIFGAFQTGEEAVEAWRKWQELLNRAVKAGELEPNTPWEKHFCSWDGTYAIERRVSLARAQGGEGKKAVIAIKIKSAPSEACQLERIEKTVTITSYEPKGKCDPFLAAGQDG